MSSWFRVFDVTNELQFLAPFETFYKTWHSPCVTGCPKCVPKTSERPIKFFFSFLQGKFTTKTDVWSFGVTLWEILTFAREQPYESQSDAKILSNLSNMWREGRPSVFLPTPHGCPREVRDLMYECWQREEKERPSFSEIHLFLQRKNLGFDPQHCQ